MFNDRIRIVFLLAACCLLVPSRLAADDCSVTLINKPGDLIRFTAVLQTDDQDENGEGEPVVFTSSGGELTESLDLYFTPRSYSFVARVANENISGNVVDSDGDETCSIVASVNQHQSLLTEAEKNYLGEESVKHAVLAVGASVVAELCLEGVVTARICALPMAGLASEFAFGAVAGAKYALDPPDPNYMVIAIPQVPVIPPMSPQSGVPQALVDATNALEKQEAQLAGVELALITTLNRISGAAAANDQFWVQRQTAIANALKAEFAAYLVQEADAIVAFDDARVSAGFTVEITSEQVQSFEADVAVNGLPDNEVAALFQLGADADLIESATQLTFVQDAEAAAAFPKTLTEPAFVALLKAAPQALLTLRRRAAAH